VAEFNRTINKNSPVPIHHQLKEFLWEIVQSLEVGDSIPTESEICDRFEISRPTVRQAVSALVAEGYLERRKGHGTFVTEPKIRRDFLLVMESFNKEMTEKGYHPTTRLVSLQVDRPDEDVGDKLMVGHTERVYYLRRLRSIHEKPFFVVDSFIPESKVPGIENYDLEKNSLHGLLQREFNFTFERAVRSIEIRPAEEAEAKLLQIEVGSPVHYVETLLYIETGEPLKFARTWYRGDRSKFTYELSRKDISQNRAHDITVDIGPDGYRST
jgi:GntR family transcriptional regulator